MKKKHALLVGITTPIKKKSKKYVLEMVYKKAKRNPFITAETFEEYLEYLNTQINSMSDESIETTNPNKIYDTLKKIGWLKEISFALLAFISVNHHAVS